MSKNGYTTMNLPTSLVEELKVWRMAFNAAYGKTVSYSDMIRGMLANIEDTEPAVHQELERLLLAHPELQGKMANKEEK